MSSLYLSLATWQRQRRRSEYMSYEMANICNINCVLTWKSFLLQFSRIRTCITSVQGHSFFLHPTWISLKSLLCTIISGFSFPSGWYKNIIYCPKNFMLFMMNGRESSHTITSIFINWNMIQTIFSDPHQTHRVVFVCLTLTKYLHYFSTTNIMLKIKENIM